MRGTHVMGLQMEKDRASMSGDEYDKIGHDWQKSLPR